MIMWILQIVCTVVIGAAGPCNPYTGASSYNYSATAIGDHEDCVREATDLALNMHLHTGNDYAFRCTQSTYQPKEIP
jgi:hypothetical protein